MSQEALIYILISVTIGGFWSLFLFWCLWFSNPKCKHINKEKLNLGVIDNTINVKFNETDIPTTYLCNSFEVYLCHECGCVVFKEVPNEQRLKD
jgi:hypothetical protein